MHIILIDIRVDTLNLYNWTVYIEYKSLGQLPGLPDDTNYNKLMSYIVLLSPYSTGNGVRVGYQTQMKSTQKT